MTGIICLWCGNARRNLARCVLPGLLLTSSGVQAQTLGAVEHRLDRVERAVRKLERNEADRKALKSNSQDAYLQLNRRLNALEQAISDMVSQQERDHHDLTTAVEQLRRLKADLEARLEELESRPQAALPASSGAAASPPAPVPATVDDRFKQAMAFAANKDWVKAEFAFDAFIASYPSDGRIPEARFQLGRAFHGQGKYAQAAQTFLDLYQKYPDAPFAIDNLFALGDALAAMEPANSGQACDVYGEIEAAHDADLSVDQRSRLLDRRLSLKCSK